MLVVDDDPEVLSLLIEVLELAGYEVDHAVNGRDALEAIEERRPDLILTDLIMPVLDGWHFIERCRERADCANVPVLVISAFAQMPETEERMQRLSVEKCMAKPFDLDDVVAHVDDVLKRRHHRSAA